ncbi:hypothetical protein F4780DRAFT_669703 [Xylariomycetidae sp. FL0641]|nr:hypothetical protein F4780DRAFT_669703 [Xylariomycetidae sp. FL0641]
MNGASLYTQSAQGSGRTPLDDDEDDGYVGSDSDDEYDVEDLLDDSEDDAEDEYPSARNVTSASQISRLSQQYGALQINGEGSEWDDDETEFGGFGRDRIIGRGPSGRTQASTSAAATGQTSTVSTTTVDGGAPLAQEAANSSGWQTVASRRALASASHLPVSQMSSNSRAGLQSFTSHSGVSQQQKPDLYANVFESSPLQQGYVEKKDSKWAKPDKRKHDLKKPRFAPMATDRARPNSDSESSDTM